MQTLDTELKSDWTLISGSHDSDSNLECFCNPAAPADESAEFGISYLGFTPEAIELRSVASEVAQIQMRAPSDSFIRLVIKKAPDGFVGFLKVNSLQGIFIAEAEQKGERQLSTLVRGLMVQMKTKLKQWLLLRRM